MFDASAFTIDAAHVEIQRFSGHVAGAKDHFTIKDGGHFYAAGVVGEPRIVVTFGKVGGERPLARIEAFERRLSGVLDATLERIPARMDEGDAVRGA